jgi:hydrogenase/urease accessory protein HupE
MRYLLAVVGVLALLVGLVMAAAAKSAIHEIEAGIGFLIFATTIGAVGIMGSIDRLREEQTPLLRILGR